MGARRSKEIQQLDHPQIRPESSLVACVSNSGTTRSTSSMRWYAESSLYMVVVDLLKGVGRKFSGEGGGNGKKIPKISKNYRK